MTKSLWSMPLVASEFLGSERCIGVGTEIFNVFVLISYRLMRTIISPDYFGINFSLFFL